MFIFVVIIAGILIWQFITEFDFVIALFRFNGSLKFALQDIGFLAKDLKYAEYVRDVVLPKERERELIYAKMELSEKVHEKILDGIERDCDVIKFRSYSYPKVKESIDEIKKIAVAYGFNRVELSGESVVIYLKSEG